MRCAAQYVRMSTHQQDTSIAFQVAANMAYAAEHDLQIVRTYTDAGISGLSIEKRDGLKALVADVVSGTGGFDVVLVYDVSRWGRFQNPDQAGHYEFICAEAGVRVEYCAEQFDNDGSPTSGIMKHIRRTMAAEYSRDLSEKVRRALHSLIAQGYWIGGEPPYGYRREIIDRAGRAHAGRDSRIWKKQQGVHVRLILGPPDEVATIRRMFRLYLKPGANIASVARSLNDGGYLRGPGEYWFKETVGRALSYDIYAGRLVSGKERRILGTRTRLPSDLGDWIVVENAAPAIVSKRTFEAVQRKRKAAARRITREDALRDLARLAEEHGTITQSIIEKHGKWSTGVYWRRIGTTDEMRKCVAATAPAGVERLREQLREANVKRWRDRAIKDDDELLTLLRGLLAREGRLTRAIIDREPSVPNPATYALRFGGMAEVYRRLGYVPTGIQARSLQAKPAWRAFALLMDREGRIQSQR